MSSAPYRNKRNGRVGYLEPEQAAIFPDLERVRPEDEGRIVQVGEYFELDAPAPVVDDEDSDDLDTSTADGDPDGFDFDLPESD
ncbi:hypothetical protein [Agromyces sp. NPDC058104]|uniref:hypothetical protein n=1 Tax=Agromyces sp. NPDC058104 TaxID=3346342 RepID=UPI0036DC5505